MTPYDGGMRWMRWAAMVLVVAAGAVLPASASAAVLAPPGHPGTNQYFETIPTSSGQAAPPGSVQGSGRTHPGSHALAGLGTGQATDSKLAKLGSVNGVACPSGIPGDDQNCSVWADPRRNGLTATAERRR